MDFQIKKDLLIDILFIGMCKMTFDVSLENGSSYLYYWPVCKPIIYSDIRNVSSLVIYTAKLAVALLKSLNQIKPTYAVKNKTF